MPANFRCGGCGMPLDRAHLKCPSCDCLDPTGFFTGGAIVESDDDDDD